MVFMGLSRRRGPTTQRHSCGLGRLCSHHVHHSPFCCCFYIASLGCGSTFSGSLWFDLPRSLVPHSEELPQTGVEPGPTEQAVPGHCSVLERMGCSGSVLAIRVPRERGIAQLCARYHGRYHCLGAIVLVVYSSRKLVAEPQNPTNAGCGYEHNGPKRSQRRFNGRIILIS